MISLCCKIFFIASTIFFFDREEDKKILQLCQTRGLSDNIYQDIADELSDKTAGQVDITLNNNCFRSTFQSHHSTFGPPPPPPSLQVLWSKKGQCTLSTG